MLTSSAAQATDRPLDAHLAQLDLPELRREFMDQGEFIALAEFVPHSTLEPLLAALPQIEPRIHRNFVPGYKKGGSVSRFDLDECVPAFGALYHDPALVEFLRALTAQPLRYCPANDPHTYALYYYTEAGDHIGFHYDTSYYKGARYTVLIGLVDESSARLEYELFRDDANRASVTGSIALQPGMLVVFNGDRVYHRVTPCAAGERRVALTLEYLTSLEMHPVRRFVSNMKDAIAYFGFRQVFGRSVRR